MAKEQQNLDPLQATVEELADLVTTASEDEVARIIRDGGTTRVLDHIFEAMQEAFLPDKAKGVDARVQFVVQDRGEDHPCLIWIKEGACAVERARTSSPRAVLTTDLVTFVKLISGQAEGVPLFVARKLKIAGDVMFSRRVPTFFDRPKKR